MGRARSETDRLRSVSGRWRHRAASAYFRRAGRMDRCLWKRAGGDHRLFPAGRIGASRRRLAGAYDESGTGPTEKGRRRRPPALRGGGVSPAAEDRSLFGEPVAGVQSLRPGDGRGRPRSRPRAPGASPIPRSSGISPRAGPAAPPLGWRSGSRPHGWRAGHRPGPADRYRQDVPPIATSQTYHYQDGGDVRPTVRGPDRRLFSVFPPVSGVEPEWPNLPATSSDWCPFCLIGTETPHRLGSDPSGIPSHGRDVRPARRPGAGVGAAARSKGTHR
jgi:hypothetical protein